MSKHSLACCPCPHHPSLICRCRERLKSIKKKKKTEKRSRLLDVHPSDQMAVMLESKNIITFDPLPAINLWNEAPRVSRRVKQIIETTEPVIMDSSSDSPVINVEADEVSHN